ncbi:hypothetical protein [Nocardioides speluncae]|uniref:hypothetical protein n=1 Tax=Nocardioides speluncae TaxID=2670337 RepID=UPI00197E983E|nr:hypothetical protein [Nocardioides speluncae]
MSTILAIDPGNTESAYALIGPECRPLYHEKIPNDELLRGLQRAAIGTAADHVAIEMIASYGMPVGADVFETCVWIGRFAEAIEHRTGIAPDLIKRHPVKLHHCHSSKAKDSNITRALVDRFAHGQPNYGKGTKAAPGWFHGFKEDVWQAYALAVYVADNIPTALTTPTPDPVPAAAPSAAAGTARPDQGLF